MGKPIKYHPHGSVLFITMSVEEGLFFLSNPLSRIIMTTCLARAQSLYPVRICHAIAEGSHIHLIAVVNNPDDIYEFMRHFKTETAHRFNAVLGRRKRTIWCEGYDSPVVLTPVRALIAIAYLYANPAKDNLEDSIDQYPALNTWKMFQKEEHTRLWKWVRRPSFHALPEDAHNLRGYTKEAEKLSASRAEQVQFQIEPNAWMEAFGITTKSDQAKINAQLVERVRMLEERARKRRKEAGKGVIGKERLLREPITTSYRPQRTGRRMWCLSEVRSQRIAFIDFLKGLISQGKIVRDLWKHGDFSLRYPLGLYPPAMPKLAEPLGIG